MFMFRKLSGILYVLLFVFTLLTSNMTLAGGGDEAAAKLAWPMIENGVLLIDVRSAEKFAEGHLDGAINIDWDDTDALIAAIGDDMQRPVVLYCRSGNRSDKSITELATRGYSSLYNATGFKALKATKPEHQ